MRAHRSIATGITALLIVAACGGDDDGTDAAPAPADEADEADDASDSGTGTGGADEPSEPAADTNSDADDAAAAESEADDAGAAPTGGDNVAMVTIGDASYEIDVTPGAIQRCDPDFFGAFWAIGGDQTVGIEMLLPPPGDPNFDEPAALKVSVADGDREWVADPAREMFGVDEGESQVDAFTVDGNSVSGTATFVDLNESYAFQGGAGDEPEPVSGTFSVTCVG